MGPSDSGQVITQTSVQIQIPLGPPNVCLQRLAKPVRCNGELGGTRVQRLPSDGGPFSRTRERERPAIAVVQDDNQYVTPAEEQSTVR